MSRQIEHIIDCAKQLLKESGHNGFSMENLALISYVDLHELHYHFENESALLTALATAELQQFCAYVSECEIDEMSNVEQALSKWLLTIIEYRNRDAFITLCKEFSVIALHNKAVYLVLDQYYRLLYQIALQKLQSISPDGSSKRNVECAGGFLMPFIEGYGIIRSTLPISVLQLSEQLSKALLAILRQK